MHRLKKSLQTLETFFALDSEQVDRLKPDDHYEIFQINGGKLDRQKVSNTSE